MKANRLALAVVAAACTLSAPAFATTITLDAVKSDIYMNNQVVTGTFNGTSLLPTSYTVNSISFLFNFKDNNDALTTGATVTTGTDKTAYVLSDSSYNYSGGYTKNIYDRDVTINKTVAVTGQRESVTVSLGGVEVGNGSTSLSETTKTSTTKPSRDLVSSSGTDGYCRFGFIVCWDWVDGVKNQYYDTTTTSTVTTTQDWTGSFTVSGTTTNQQLINQLLASNTLQFGLNVTGDLYLTAAQVKLDITQTAVPEPSTIALALAGLAGLGYARRKGKRS